jgi:hypothetical protein
MGRACGFKAVGIHSLIVALNTAITFDGETGTGEPAEIFLARRPAARPTRSQVLFWKTSSGRSERSIGPFSFFTWRT